MKDSALAPQKILREFFSQLKLQVRALKCELFLPRNRASLDEDEELFKGTGETASKKKSAGKQLRLNLSKTFSIPLLHTISEEQPFYEVDRSVSFHVLALPPYAEVLSGSK